MRELLRRLREQAGLTVPEAAERIGVHKATVYAWESEGKIPEPPQLRRAMDAYSASEEERAEVARLRAFGPDPETTGEEPPAAVA
jgi:transcriptional regulator with XRE-family HTH domain